MLRFELGELWIEVSDLCLLTLKAVLTVVTFGDEDGGFEEVLKRF